MKRDYMALTFDCYGTLVDWRGGLLGAVRAALPPAAGLDAGRFLSDRQAAEARLQAGAYRPYREIVAGSVRQGLAAQGIAMADASAAAVAASVGDWKPFNDTAAALRVLGRGRRLVIVSNVDRRDLLRSVDRIGVSFDLLVTAENVGSYKPARAHLDAALAGLGLEKESVLHVAQSLYHDIRPAAALGFDTAWVDRLGEPPPDGVVPTFHVPDMASLATRLGARGARRNA